MNSSQFGILSDLHTDFGDYDFKEKKNVHYINAGDICHSNIRRNKFITKHPDVMTITGNHDYYGYEALPWKEASEHKYKWERDGLIIRGATLWTHMKTDYDYWLYSKCLNDDTMIHGMSYETYNHVHTVHKQWLFAGDADIIVIHHAPSYLSVTPRFKGDLANQFFVNDLDEKIMNLTKKPKLIIHGHVHSTNDYMIGETRVICNPRGYPRENTYYDSYEPRIIKV